ncbi:MAG: DNA primase DnaG [Candidatus Pacearchaeota archaeon]
MGKISPISIKYLIKIKFTANGIVEKPDVIGAIFGQTEGLLGEELELRELQKKGKIGRIEAEIKYEGEKTSGIVQIPTALDKTETTLVAAAIETIDRIGPTEAKFEVIEVEDVREEKRKYIVERAKELLKKITEKLPESKEIQEAVKLTKKVSEIREIGKEKLPAGNIEGKEIIIVEGRADVINLIKHNIDNVIAMNGIKVPSTIKKISKEKETTLFIDGDRGGLLLAKSALKSGAKIDYIAIAPDGKEVEELVGKEILSALRKRVPASEFIEKYELNKGKLRGKIKSIQETGKEEKEQGKEQGKEQFEEKVKKKERKPRKQAMRKGIREKTKEREKEKIEKRIEEGEAIEAVIEAQKEMQAGEKIAEKTAEKTAEKIGGKEKEEIYKKIKPFLDEARDSGLAYIVDKNFRLIKTLPFRNLKFLLRKFIGYCLIVDGSVDDYLIDIAERSGFKIVAARNFIIKREHRAVLISF